MFSGRYWSHFQDSQLLDGSSSLFGARLSQNFHYLEIQNVEIWKIWKMMFVRDAPYFLVLFEVFLREKRCEKVDMWAIVVRFWKGSKNDKKTYCNMSGNLISNLGIIKTPKIWNGPTDPKNRLTCSSSFCFGHFLFSKHLKTWVVMPSYVCYVWPSD